MPSRSRFSSASAQVVNSRSESWSVTMRLISSGIAAVAAAQAGLDVSDGHVELGRDERRRPAWN